MKANVTGRFIADERGATMIEYALIAAALSLVIYAGAAAFGVSLADMFTRVSGIMDGAG